MRVVLFTTGFAFALGLASVPLGQASAQDLELHMGRNGPSVRMGTIAIPVSSVVVTVTNIGETVRKNAHLDGRSKKRGGWVSTALALSVSGAAASRLAGVQRVSS